MSYSIEAVTGLWARGYYGRDIKIELCVELSHLRLSHVGHVVQIGGVLFRLLGTNSVHVKAKLEWKIYFCELALSSEPQMRKFHVVFWHTKLKHCTKKRAARAARLFFFIQPIKSLICGVVVDVAVVKSYSATRLTVATQQTFLQVRS